MSILNNTPIPSGYKRCTKCGEVKVLDSFARDSRAKSGLRACCRACDSKRHKAFREDNRALVKQRQRDHYVKNKSVINARNRRYYAEHAEELVEYQRIYRIVNPEKSKACNDKSAFVHRDQRNAHKRDQRESDPDKAREKDRQYYAMNSEWWRTGKGKMKAMAHRARKQNLPVEFTLQDWHTCLDKWGHCCAYCSSQQGLWNPITADHFIPLVSPDCLGTVKKNMLPACKTCNSSKQDTNPIEWITRKFGKRKAKLIIARINAYFEEMI